MNAYKNAQKYLNQGYSHIPVQCVLPADLDTPLSVYLKLANNTNSYLLESVQGGEKWGRHSFIGLGSSEHITVFGNSITHYQADQKREIHSDTPLDWIEAWRQQFKTPQEDGLPVFSGGLVGYFGYESIAYMEDCLNITALPDNIGTPDIYLTLSTEVIAFDNLKNEMHLIIYAADDSIALEQAAERLHVLCNLLQQKPCPLPQPMHAQVSKLQYNFKEEAFKRATETICEYIKNGDSMQVVLAQQMQMPVSGNSLALYRAIRNINPSPYMFFLRLDGFEIIGSSPEILVRLEQDGQVCVRPIAGTRVRGNTPQHDLALEQDLLADPKELAEHLMLIDLGRNDIGRVCEVGSVVLNEKMIIERYSHVMHIVSNVVGKLRAGLSPIDVLKATFPAGTVSGAPKIRAMEIIHELEPCKRGIYSGAVGYIGWHGNLDTAIAIRTAVVKDNTLFIQAGAGIVADSNPDSEWTETVNKAKALIRAAEKVSSLSPQ